MNHQLGFKAVTLRGSNRKPFAVLLNNFVVNAGPDIDAFGFRRLQPFTIYKQRLCIREYRASRDFRTKRGRTGVS